MAGWGRARWEQLVFLVSAGLGTHGAATRVLVTNETEASNVCASPICRTLIPHTSWDSGPKKAAKVADPQLYNAETQQTVAMAVAS